MSAFSAVFMWIWLAFLILVFVTGGVDTSDSWY